MGTNVFLYQFKTDLQEKYAHLWQIMTIQT